LCPPTFVAHMSEATTLRLCEKQTGGYVRKRWVDNDFIIITVWVNGGIGQSKKEDYCESERH